jgi:hypothetical protein
MISFADGDARLEVEDLEGRPLLCLNYTVHVGVCITFHKQTLFSVLTSGLGRGLVCVFELQVEWLTL